MKNRNAYQGAVKYDLNPTTDPVDNTEYSIEKEKTSKFKYTPNDKRQGLGVSLWKDESIDSLLKRFKKTVLEHDIMKQYQESAVFVKPSVTARLKKEQRKFKSRRASQNYK
jgi:ribosomal protein S21